ncbi:MAG: CoA-binding protein [Proteobacteria bacterium]|nr:CoA-binding protein [Pseudomonadota bacterium]
MPDNPLHLLLNPRSIAIAGASNNPMKMGTMQALSILTDGWRGEFYPVHPTEKTVLGRRAYASPLDLPEAPDLAMLVVPTAQVVPLLEDFAKIGAKRAIVISAGFKETGEEGRKLEERLREIAETYGIRFLGPNCMGIVNTENSLNVTVAALEKRPGHLGMASQSGTYITQTLAYLRARGIRFSKAISCGNEADIDIIDALEYLGEEYPPGDPPRTDGGGHHGLRGAAPEIRPADGRLLVFRPRGRQYLCLYGPRRPGLRLAGEGGAGDDLAAEASGDPLPEADHDACPAAGKSGGRRNHPDGARRRAEGPGRAPGEAGSGRLRRSRHPRGDRNHSRGGC